MLALQDRKGPFLVMLVVLAVLAASIAGFVPRAMTEPYYEGGISVIGRTAGGSQAEKGFLGASPAACPSSWC